MLDQQLTNRLPDGYNEPKIALDRPESEIVSVLKRTDNSASRLHMRIDALYNRLTPVILPVGASTACVGNSPGVPQAVMSPLGDGIRSIEQQIDNACDRLESLLRDLSL